MYVLLGDKLDSNTGVMRIEIKQMMLDTEGNSGH